MLCAALLRIMKQAARLAPVVRMNPVLLKPTSDQRSQVITCGRPVGTMTAMEYHPAEINLRESDIVNMAMAETAARCSAFLKARFAHNARPRRMPSAVLHAIRTESALIAHRTLGLLDQALAYVNRTKV